MKKFICLLLVFILAFGPVSAFAKYDLSFKGAVDNPLLKEIIKNASRNDENALMYPPEEHPYLFVNDEFIASLKENKNSADYKAAYDFQLTLANNDLPSQPEGGYLSKTINNQLKARAFMYVMDEVDKKHAKDTVAFTIEYLKNAKTRETYSIYIYKDFGTAFEMGGLVYDWCYDVMTDAQRSELAEIIKNLVCDPVQPARPDNAAAWSDINGYSVGQPLQNGSIAVTAIYDAYPDIYEKYMSKVQGSMAQASKIYGEAGALTDGSIAYAREIHTYMVQLMFDRMGYDTSEKYGYTLPLGYFLLYLRTPYGSQVPYGDGSLGTTFGKFQNSHEIQENIGILNVRYEDPYLKHYYERENSSKNDIFTLLCYKSDHKAETLDSLPLSYETFSPRSALVAKTSWQEGKDSPAVMAYMNMNNRRSGDHDHADHGSFQLFYKGPLSMPGGGYWGEDWGLSHWRNYYTRTISKNCVTVLDPNEIYTYGNAAAEVNDGGQLGAKSSSGGYVIEELKEHMSDEKEVTKTVGTYIGPNEKTPAFSYIKGDLTRAYSQNKMAGYQRSMVFMDTFNETYPGVFIVFDHVTSTQEKYKKTFLLQAVAEPHILGNTITIINSETNPEANGKLVNTTLIPEKVNILVEGGDNKFVAGGKEWPIIGEDTKTKDVNSYQSEPFNRAGWRAEISPASEKKEDIFLNAMFMADANTTAPDLEFKKVEEGDMVGVVALDRQVMFKKDGKAFEKEFTLNVADNNSGGKMLVLVTDVKEGKWKIKGNNFEEVAQCKEYDNAFVFEALPGKYTITPVKDDAVTKKQWPEAEKEKIGDFSVKVNDGYQYLRHPSKLVDGVPYIPVSVLEYSTPSTVVRNGDEVMVETSVGSKVTMKAGSKEYTVTVSGETTAATMDYAPFVADNGEIYFCYKGIENALGMACSYIESAASLKIALQSPETGAGLAGVDESRVINPVRIFASSDDGNVPENIIDRNLKTRWSSFQGDGEWCAFQLSEEAVEISAVQIAWYNGDKRNWKFDIETSDDGKAWTKVLEGKKSGGKTLEVETFNLPAGTKAKYIRYFGHGEEVTKSYFNSVTEFLVIK